MPLGFERLNERQRRPNIRINFIKPLEGPDRATAQDFLERVAAICEPVMKANHLSVMSLEEHEPNREFVGRNFNAGEVIQLVLKVPSTGRWLPFRYVQMVMMHELAHCKQMNHSRAFWKVRNQYTEELNNLWQKDYTGEGLWSRGRTLYDGQLAFDNMPSVNTMPEHLCGGIYRSSHSKRKRSAKPQLSYAERKQRRIAKRFGVNGVPVGDEKEARVRLENGKKPKGKPRVAGSARGRELRAAAALARFDSAMTVDLKRDRDEESESESEPEYGGLPGQETAKDSSGKNVLDSKGRAMVKVCEDENSHNDPDAIKELEELTRIDHYFKPNQAVQAMKNTKPMLGRKGEDDGMPSIAVSPESSKGREEKSKPHKPLTQNTSRDSAILGTLSRDFGFSDSLSEGGGEQSFLTCLVCSLVNEPGSLTCAACANVLDTTKRHRYWRCTSDACQNSQYLNSSDVCACGICQSPKPVQHN